MSKLVKLQIVGTGGHSTQRRCCWRTGTFFESVNRGTSSRRDDLSLFANVNRCLHGSMFRQDVKYLLTIFCVGLIPSCPCCCVSVHLLWNCHCLVTWQLWRRSDGQHTSSSLVDTLWRMSLKSGEYYLKVYWFWFIIIIYSYQVKSSCL